MEAPCAHWASELDDVAAGGSFRVRRLIVVSSIPTRPDKGSRYEALMAVIDAGLALPEVDRIAAVCDVENLASIKYVSGISGADNPTCYSNMHIGLIDRFQK